MTVKEAAKELNLTEYTVRVYIKKGLLKAKKIHKGRRYTYDISEKSVKQHTE